MKLIIIFGPHAVGKMTVGQALCKETGLKLFHNHMTIEPLLDLFANDPKERGKLTNLFREEIFKSFLSGPEKGMVFTYMWAFDAKEDWDYIESVKALAKERNTEVYFVELEADYNLRLERNKTENRLLHKPSKRDLERSEMLFKSIEEKYRLNSLPGEIKEEHYLRIDNTALSPEEAAKIIKETFEL